MIRVEIDKLVLDRAAGLDPEAIRAKAEAELARRGQALPRATSRAGEGARTVAKELAAVIRENLGRAS